MMYVGGFFVEIAEILKKFICKLWLVFFSERNIFFRNSNSITNFEFWFSIFLERFV